MNSSSSKGKVSKLSPFESGVAGGISSFLTRGILQPLDVLKIRFQLQVESTRKKKGGLYYGVLQAARTISKNEGFLSLWKGHVPAQILTVSYGIGQFWSFTFFKTYAENMGIKDSGIALSISGGLSGIVGTLISLPFDIARTRIVAQSIPEYSDMFDVWRKILAKENVFGLWRGLTPTLLMTVPFAAIQFRLYYLFSSLISPDIIKEKRVFGFEVTKPAVSGALAGVFAKLAVYPLDVLKKRMQIRGSEDTRRNFGKVAVYHSMVDCIRRVTAEEGILAWFKGLEPSLVKSAAFSALVFCFYEMSANAILTIKKNF